MAIPDALWTYIRGLKSHDVELIGSTFADGIAFVTPVKTMNREEILAFLSALYSGFPDWAYDHDPPEHRGEDAYAVLWRQGGTHTHGLALPGFPAVEATDRKVVIPQHYFFYRVTANQLTEIRPDPVPGGAPRGIFEQIGVKLPPL
jgi:hypothetical protein